MPLGERSYPCGETNLAKGGCDTTHLDRWQVPETTTSATEFNGYTLSFAPQQLSYELTFWHRLNIIGKCYFSQWQRSSLRPRKRSGRFVSFCKVQRYNLDLCLLFRPIDCICVCTCNGHPTSLISDSRLEHLRNWRRLGQERAAYICPSLKDHMRHICLRDRRHALIIFIIL